MRISEVLDAVVAGPVALAADVRRGFSGRWAQRKGDSFTKAYAKSLAHRLPMLYLVVFFNCVLMALRLQSDAPLWLTLFGPLVIGGFAIMRAFYWLPHKISSRPLPVLRRDLRTMSWLGSGASLVFALWAITLSAYGDEAGQSFIHYMVAVTLFSGLLGLGHAPLTALRIAGAVSLPTSFQILYSGHSNALQVVLVQIVVTAALLLITKGHHRDFVQLELSRQKLFHRERKTAQLARVTMLQATVDPLTGALNRRAILARLETELACGHTGKAAAWLALIDLDGFKHINDTYGHAAGDTVLAAIAARLSKVDRLISYGRLGGDEFAVIFDASLDETSVHSLASSLSDALRAPVLHANAVLRLSGSIGVHRVAGRSVSDCLERADAALYKAKEQSDGTVVVFSPDDETELLQRAAITRQFNNSDLEDRIKLVYQPIIDISNMRITGFEAFARWSPDGQIWLTPGQFMSLAEATGRTGELTKMVMVQALAECRAWEHGRTLSINLGPRDVMRAGTPDVLAQLTQAAGAPPHMIILEVTERALIDDPKRAEAQLKAFRALGFRIALDDFGAGWSSLNQVHNLPLDVIKIDQALSRALVNDPGARALVSSIVSLAWQLGIDCTIEGVEDEAQAATARSLGVRLMQGYHFGHPAPAQQAMSSLVGAISSVA